MLRISARRHPSESRHDLGFALKAYPFSSPQVDLEDENLRWDFRQQEVRLELEFSSGLSLRAVWPALDEELPFFYFARKQAPVLRQVDLSVEAPRIAIVPILTPLDHNEQLLSQQYVEKNLNGRLASRHFRNQLNLLSKLPSSSHASEFAAFNAFSRDWLPEMSLEEPATRPAEKRYELDVYYREGASTRELVWAGDGMQVYIQMLLHVYRNRFADVLVLDEPDVYLHADLQRRLLRVLSHLDIQVVLASHSTELVSEAPEESVVWVDRTRSTAVRAPKGKALASLSDSIGSPLMRLARLFRARAALFVEGRDMAVLRQLAAKVGAPSVVAETALAVVAM